MRETALHAQKRVPALRMHQSIVSGKCYQMMIFLITEHMAIYTESVCMIIRRTII